MPVGAFAAPLGFRFAIPGLICIVRAIFTQSVGTGAATPIWMKSPRF